MALKYYKDREEMPDWVKEKDNLTATRQLVDGCVFSAGVDIHELGGERSMTIKQIKEEEFDGLNDTEKVLEVISGCLVAWLAAMAGTVGPDIFRQYIAPLPTIIGLALVQLQSVPAPDKERVQAVGKQLEALMPELEEKMRKIAEQQGLKANVEEDEEGALAKAVKNLKKGLLH